MCLRPCAHKHVMLSRRLKSHQSIIVVYCFESISGDNHVARETNFRYPPGYVFSVCENYIIHARKFSRTNPANSFISNSTSSFSLWQTAVHTTLLYCLFIRWLFFFSFALLCLPLFRRLHSSRKHLLRLYTPQTPITAIVVHRGGVLLILYIKYYMLVDNRNV